MEEHWETLTFGPGAKNVEYHPSYIRSPSRNIKQLRVVARAGRDETNRLAIENAGKDKVVWGVPETISALDVAESSLELAMEDTSSAMLPAVSEEDIISGTMTDKATDPDVIQGLNVIASGLEHESPSLDGSDTSLDTSDKAKEHEPVPAPSESAYLSGEFEVSPLTSTPKTGSMGETPTEEVPFDALAANVLSEVEGILSNAATHQQAEVASSPSDEEVRKNQST